MSLNYQRRRGRVARCWCTAFSLVEVLVAMGIAGIAFAALFSGISFILARIQSSRESLRATQIMVEKLDTIRLYAWDKVVTPGYIPTRFTVPFQREDGALSALGFIGDSRLFYGTTTIATNLTGFPSSYQQNLCSVTVSLSWTNGPVARSASMTTLVAKNGLQTYIYQP